ncbi:hypothetical protein Stube_03560 [Streptomyces tubercidicus]|uniref:Uncharacterized protein n=1 Tax=Streptomyces tubercidicus TaxID=47759 RepID=A0A640UHZ4_9ACTN|nr:hypothetical protein Stube_03560 [Streptomyces tubercidicus]
MAPETRATHPSVHSIRSPRKWLASHSGHRNATRPVVSVANASSSTTQLNDTRTHLHTASADTSHTSLTHLGEQGSSLLMLMAKSRHKKPENVRRYFKPSPEAIAELTSLLAPGDNSR